MLVYESDKYRGNWDSSSIWRQSLKRTTSTPIPTSAPPNKRLKLSATNKKFLKSLGFKVL